MIVADRSDSNSEIQRRQDVYYQFINKAFILKVIRKLTLYLHRSLFHRSLRVISLSPFPPFLRMTYHVSL